MADPLHDYRERLSVVLKAAMQLESDLAELVRAAHRLGRVDEAERLERMAGLADAVDDGVRDVTYEVDGLQNAGHVSRVIVADVGVPPDCLKGLHVPAPKNLRRCLYCSASPLTPALEVVSG